MKYQLRKNMMHHAIRNRLLLSYFSIGTLLLLVFSSIIMNTTFNNALQDTTRDIEGLLEQNYRTAEQLLKKLSDNITDSAITDPAIIMGLYGDNFENFNMYNIHATLAEMANSNPIIDSIYVYNHFVGKVFSSLSTVRPVEDFYEPDIRNIVNEGLSDRVRRLIPRYTTLQNINDNYPEKRWLTMVLSQTNDKSGSAVLINISQKALQDLIYQKDETNIDFIESFIIRTDGIIISHEKSEMFGIDASQLPYIEEIINSSSQRGEFETVIDSKRVNVKYIRSESFESIFITLISYEELKINARGRLKWIFLITALFLVLGGLGAFFFTRVIYSPLGRLVQVAEMGMGESSKISSHSEYEIVTTFINYLNIRLSEAWRTINENIPEKKRVTLQRLLLGSIPGESLKEYWKDEFDIDFSVPFYSTVIIWSDSMVGQDKGVPDYKLIQQHQSEKIEYVLQAFSPYFKLEIVDMELGQLVVIINIDDEMKDTYRDHLRLISGKISEWSREKGNSQIWMCAGPVAESIDEIQRVYNRTIEISRYHFALPQKAFIEFQDIEKNLNIEYEYPSQLEEKIIQAIRLGAESDLELLFHDFSQSVSLFRYNEIMLSLTQLVLIISRTAQPSEEGSIQERWIQVSANQRKYNNMSLTMITDWIKGICIEIINHSKAIAETKHISLLEKVKSIVSENYGDSSLCAATIAESVGLSTNYLRQIFKKNYGQSLSDYIAGYRFDKAKELLINSKLTTKKIAELCGFYNADYFYYAFRKMTGSTPGDFRKNRISLYK